MRDFTHKHRVRGTDGRALAVIKHRHGGSENHEHQPGAYARIAGTKVIYVDQDYAHELGLDKSGPTT